MKNILIPSVIKPTYGLLPKIPMRMRIATVLLAGFLIQANAETSYSQEARISLEMRNATVEEVLNEIETRSEFHFLYNSKLIDVDRKVTVDVDANNIESVLKILFDGTDITYKVSDKQIVLQRKAWSDNESTPRVEQSDQKVITGTVMDAFGPVAGANVIVKGTTNGTMTDMEGKFSLEVPEGATLEISYIGYVTQQIKVGSQTTLNITLKEDSQALDEVVVVGYGTKKKINLTGAVAAVGGEDLVKTSTSKLSNAIAGRMPGVMALSTSGEPASQSTLSIRGNSTLNNNTPLIVVDGIPRDGFDNFDPNEIESITVLKDGAAAAIYGARANNGVFLVTTKRGKQGKFNISYNGTASFQSPTKYPDVMSAYEFATNMNTALDNMGYDRNNPAQASRYYSDADIEKYRTGQAGGNWYKASFKDVSLMQNHNVTIDGGTDKVRYFFSMGAVDQDGMYDNINYKAYKFRSNIDADITPILRVGTSLDGRYEIKDSPAVGSTALFQHATSVLPTLAPYYPSGRPINTGGEHVVEEIYHSGYNQTKYNTFQGTITVNLKLDAITEGLSANGNVSFGKYYDFGKVFSTPYMLYSEDDAGNVIGTKTSGGEGGKTTLTESFNQTYSTFLNVGLNYQRTFGKHDVSGLLLYEQNQSKGDSFSGTKRDFPIDSKDELFVSGSENQSLTGTSSINDARRAVVGRLGYVLDTKYLFEFSFRADASYIFPSNKRWGFFPAVSAGWRISEESFFRQNSSLDFISNLKLRASFAQVGNDKVSAYQWQDAYTLSSVNGPFFNDAAQSIIYYGVYPNTNITWETANNYNMGIDADFWNGKLGVELDYFIKDTRDILWSRTRSVPDTFGRSLPNENYASMLNKGFEISLTHNNSIGKVNYNLRFTASYAKDKVTTIDDPENAMDYEKQLNRPLGFIAGYKSLGLFQSQEEAESWMGGQQFGVESMAGDIKYADIDGNGTIDSRDQTVLSDNGNMPRFMYGLSGNLTWNNFDFSFLLQGAAARNVMLSNWARVSFYSGGNSYAYLADAWSPENTDAEYPQLWVGSRSINDRNSDFWMRNGRYLRLKNISIGYTFPKFSIRNWNINHLRVFVSGQDLLTWSPLKEFDPEIGSGTGTYYPQQKVFSVGLNINF